MRPPIRLLALAVAGGAWVALAGGISAAPALAAPPPEVPEMRALEAVTNVTARTAVVHGVLDSKAASPEALVEYDFFYGGGGSTCDEAGAESAPRTPGTAAGAQGQAVEASLSGLSPDTEYSVCLGARDMGAAFELSERSAPVKFKTAAMPPDVLSESVSERWATAVLLEARIDNEGEPTQCFFQYGEASVSEHEVSCGSIGGEGEETLSAKVEGLTAGHAYRWRTVAKNAVDTSYGNEQSFTTTITPEPPELLGRAVRVVAMGGGGRDGARERWQRTGSPVRLGGLSHGGVLCGRWLLHRRSWQQGGDGRHQGQRVVGPGGGDRPAGGRCDKRPECRVRVC